MPEKSLLFLFFVFLTFKNFAQCSVTISTFPYQQGFEANTGSWTSGGTGNDWAWGSPSKSFINSAGGGNKCWVTGGLTGSFYTNGERSYVMSPCFDFTLLPNPVISFKIYWECENTYDGATFQYTLDNGLNWINVGSDADPTDCMTQNWFNNSAIINLTTLAFPKSGWAGSSMPTSGSCQGGGGSNGWVTAKHCLSNLGGMPEVRFRFAFGAGTTCNNYDGIAFDDIRIENAMQNNANFSFNCSGNSLQYQFTNISSLCPNNFVWNFGDPASGSNNGTGLQNPVHTFSSPGTYTVSLTISGPCNGNSTITKTISTIGMNLNTTNLPCANSLNGSITATAINNTGLANFLLQPSGSANSTGIFNGLMPGSYTVTVTDAIGCSVSSLTTITSPPALVWINMIPTNISCHGLQDGKINTQASGGTGSITYVVNPSGIINSSGVFNNLSAGLYTVTASDGSACTLSTILSISDPATIDLISSSYQNVLCHGNQSGSINIIFSGGTGILNYQLNPLGTINSTGSFTNLPAGNYTIICTDQNACSNSTSVTITEPPLLNINSVDIQQPGCNPNNDGTVTVNAGGGTLPLSYAIAGNFGSNNFFANLTSNTYTVIVKDGNGCTAGSIITLKSIDAPEFISFIINDVSCADKNDGSIQVSAVGNAPIQLYTLSPGGYMNSNGNFSSLTPGNYTITVSDANGCTNTSMAKINAPKKLQIDKLEFISEPCGSNSQGRLLIDVSGGSGDYQYQSDHNTGSQSSNIFINPGIGNIIIKVTDANGCTATSNILIPERICCEEIFIPNAFSPNGDGRNDEFGLKGTNGIELKEFLIFNRWGELVFKAQHLFDSWNGHYKGVDAETGTYFYRVKYHCLSSGKMYVLKGDVILIR